MMPFLSRFLLIVSASFTVWTTLAQAQPNGRVETDLSGSGWSLWLDRAAEWKTDPLFFPTPPLNGLPVNPPTGGWDGLIKTDALRVSVPGTVEEYLQKTPGPDGDITGVSWWTRHVEISGFKPGRRVLLRFESMRQRAEIFVNRHLAGYDVVGNSPVEIDVSAFIERDGPCEIAVRITDPAGNFDWRDSAAMRWGKYALPMSHGFGGITGRVALVICDPVYVADIYIQNTPALTEANAIITLRNTSGAPVKRDLELAVSHRGTHGKIAFQTTLRDTHIAAGESTLTIKISAPDAKAWTPDDPQLYDCDVKMRAAENGTVSDHARQSFGFRWFTAEGLGTDAILKLNNRRIVLRSAISWGFWPINGIFPTPELAEKQIRVAKALGLNMLNFHRAIGNPVVFEKADELGLLYFEEPGAYKSVTNDPFGRLLAREKFLRMVRRDRSHPSLVIYNLINEWDSRNPHPNPAEIARHREDMAAAHAIDPSRFILHTSAWARGVDIDDPAKMHFRPFDENVHMNGWYDVHHAGGPAVWNDGLYRDPTHFHNVIDNAREIVFWGEEGAISTPPRLEKIKASLDASPTAGWDGALYQEWFKTFDAFLDEKNLRSAFPSVDALTSTMGDVSFLHQGKRIENMRMSNVGDGYTINGWESEIIENHSGIVDCFRNPKGHPAILSYYNQPQYIAVKVRTSVVQPSGEVVADFFAINEKNLRGPHRLHVALRDETGHEVSTAELPVNLTGGDVYGQLLAENIRLPVSSAARGALQVEARLIDATDTELARGHDNVWAVDWQHDDIPDNGAIWEYDNRVGGFLAQSKKLTVPAYADSLPALNWIVTTASPLESDPVPVPASQLHLTESNEAGLRATFFSDPKFQSHVLSRVDPRLSYSVEDGAAPDPALAVMSDYGVRWEGVIQLPHSGRYVFVSRSSGPVKLVIDGHTIIDGRPGKTSALLRGEIEIPAAKSASFRLDFQQGRGAARCELNWVAPGDGPSLAQPILERVRRDGTTLIVLDHADAWMPLISQMPESHVRYDSAFKVGRTWLGGIHFVREHPLMRGLPVNTAMDWPYQDIVRNGDERLGLEMSGEELVAGCYHCYPMKLGTAVGVIRLGRGRIVFSTLDIAGNLNRPEGPAQVARKLLFNFLNYSAEAKTPATR